MGSYQGQAALVLKDETRIEGQAQVRTSRRRWEGTLTLATTSPFEQADEVARIELPTGEGRPVTVTEARLDGASGTFVLTFTSDTEQ